MKVWTGKVLRAGSGGQSPSEEVTARIVVREDTVVDASDQLVVSVDVSREEDALGQPRWEKSGPFSLDPRSLCIALANAVPTQAPCATTAEARLASLTPSTMDDVKRGVDPAFMAHVAAVAESGAVDRVRVVPIDWASVAAKSSVDTGEKATTASAERSDRRDPLPNPRLAITLRDALGEIPAGAEVVESRVAPGPEIVRNLGVSKGETVLVLRLKNGAERALFVRTSGIIHVHDLAGRRLTSAMLADHHALALNDLVEKIEGVLLKSADQSDCDIIAMARREDVTHAQGLRHRVVSDVLDKLGLVIPRHPNAPDQPDEQAALLDRIDLALRELDGGEDGFIPKPAKIPERIDALTKAVREALGEEHPGVGWTLVDRYKGAAQAASGDVDTLRPVLRAAGYEVVPAVSWEDIVSWLVGTGCDVSDESPDGKVTVRRGDSFTTTIDRCAGEDTLHALSKRFQQPAHELYATIVNYAVQARGGPAADLVPRRMGTPPAKRPPFHAPVQAESATWTAKVDTLVYGVCVLSGDTVTVAKSGPEVFVSVGDRREEWLPRGYVSAALLSEIENDIRRFGRAFITHWPGSPFLVSPLAVREHEGHFLLLSGGKSAGRIYAVFTGRYTANLMEAVTTATE